MIFTEFFDVIINLDVHLQAVINQYGIWTYLILWLIIFLETGLVVTPFLPGDSLLFVAGAFAAVGLLNVAFVFILLFAAAVLGDTVNYWIGYYVGPKVFKKNEGKWLNKKYLDETAHFYEKYGKLTIVLARFVPIIRTFAPFVAGIGSMNYVTFVIYNIVGGLIWSALFIFGGYFFGNLPWVQQNFSLMILLIIVASLIPIAVKLIGRKK